jgi:hypothetical protein
MLWDSLARLILNMLENKNSWSGKTTDVLLHKRQGKLEAMTSAVAARMA